MTKNLIATLDHINLSVHNLRESVDWYQKIFNFKLIEQGLNREGKPWGILRSGASMICLHEKKEQLLCNENAPEYYRFHRIYHFAFRIEDKLEWEASVKENQLQTYYDSPVEYPFSHSWYVLDPSGHEIEVVVYKGEGRWREIGSVIANYKL